MNVPPPSPLLELQPETRLFPASYINAAIIVLFEDGKGVLCKGCNKYFYSPQEIKILEGDHIMPFSQGGATNWKNLQLLCKPCNQAKNDKIEEVSS